MVNSSYGPGKRAVKPPEPGSHHAKGGGIHAWNDLAVKSQYQAPWPRPRGQGACLCATRRGRMARLSFARPESPRRPGRAYPNQGAAAMGRTWSDEDAQPTPPTSVVDDLGVRLHGEQKWARMKAKQEADAVSAQRQKKVGYALAALTVFVVAAMFLIGAAVGVYLLLHNVAGWV